MNMRGAAEKYIPQGWVWTTVGDISNSIQYGYTASATSTPCGAKFLRITDIQENSVNWDAVPYCQINETEKEKFLLREGDLVFARTGATVGKSFLISGNIPESVFASYLIRICLDKNVCESFIANFFQSHSYWSQIHDEQAGIGQPNVNATKLSQIEIPLPPLPEQHRIVSKIEELFTKLDTGVDELKRAKAQLKRYRQAVLNAAFEGELTTEWREDHKGNIESVQILLSKITEFRNKHGIPTRTNNDIVRSDLSTFPDLPEGWLWTNWEQIGFSQNGRLFPSKDYSEKGVKLLRPGNLHESGKIVWNESNTRFLPHNYEDDHPSFIVGSEELVMNLTAQSLKDEFLGRICLTSPSEHCLLNQRIARLAPIIVSKKYMFWIFKSKLFRKFVNRLNTGSLIQHMFTSQLASFFLPLPPLGEQEQIVTEIDFRFSVLQNIENTLETSLYQSQIIRRSILRKAFSGRLVPQDPSDEPAEKLIERIRECASKTVQSRRRRKSNGDAPNGK